LPMGSSTGAKLSSALTGCKTMDAAEKTKEKTIKYLNGLPANPKKRIPDPLFFISSSQIFGLIGYSLIKKSRPEKNFPSLAFWQPDLL
jgi:hypothetical protein